MKEEYPIFKKENLMYERKEKEGYWTIICKFHPELRELVINPTARKILELCNGKRTVEEIVNEMKNLFPMVPKEKIQQDVITTLSKFSRLLVIEWIGENPFLHRRETPLLDDLTAMIAQEEDLLKIKEIIERSNLFQSEREKDPNIYLYKDPLISSTEEYMEVSLRAKIFHFAEEFFLLKNKEKTIGLISITPPMRSRITAAIIKLIISPKDSFLEFLNYAQDSLPFVSIGKITKLKIYEATSEKLDPDLEKALLSEGYKEETVMEHELDFSNHLRVLVKHYSRDFIEKVELQKACQIVK